MKKLLLLSTSIISMALTSFAVSIDTSEAGNWSGYMAVFDNAGGSQGGYLWGSDWGAADLDSSNSGGVLTFSPNTNAYRDMADDGARAYWSNSSDGGLTAGPDGNKWLEATYKLEAADDNQAWNGQSLSLSGTVDSYTLDSRYSISAFIKTLDVNGGWATVQNEAVSITSTGDFSVSLDVLGGAYVSQIGFTMVGLNANEATDWGSVSISNLSASAVPEPSTYALIAGFAAFFFVAIRRRK